MRITVATAVACFLGVGISAAHDAQAAIKKETTIPAQGLGPALKQLANERDIQLVYRSEVVGDRQTSGAAGELTVDQALTRLLRGTGLTYEYIDDRAITIVPMQDTAPTRGDTNRQFSSSAIWDRFRVAQVEQGSSNSSAASAEAAERRSSLEEIIVTAQKSQQRLQDVPVPVTAIGAASLVTASQTRLQDYYTKAPGLSLVSAGNGNAPRMVIRGLTTGGSTNPTTGTVIDEVSYGFSVSPQVTPTTPDIDPGDLAHVEVLRGPQGALYGNSSIGGLLKFVTIDPSTERFSGRVQVGTTEVSSSDELGYNVRGAMNLPLGDTFAVRASGFEDRGAGYVDNVQTGERDANRRDSTGGRLAALWQPSDAFSLKLSALLQDSERQGEDEADLRFGSNSLKRSSLAGTGLYDRRTQAYSATMLGKLGDVEMVSATGYSVDDEKSNIDLTTVLGGLYSRLASASFGVGAAAQPFDVDTDKLTQEIRLTVPLRDNVEWLFGAFYTEEDIATAANLIAADPATGVSAGTLLAADTQVNFKEYAAFTNFTLQLTERFDLQLGGRFSENRQSFSTSRSGPLVVPFFGGVFSVPEVRSEESAFTYLVTPRFKVSADVMVYARLASGYRPGGPNTNCGAAGIPCEFSSDTTQNYDLGVKAGFIDGALSIDASLYYIDWKDIQVGVRPGAIGYLVNGGRAKSRGAELSVEARPLSDLTVSAWVSYNDAEMSEVPPSSTLGAVPGSQLPFSSPFSGTLSVNQEFPIGRTALAGFAGASVSYVDDRKGAFRPGAAGLPSPQETYPAYTKVDLNAGITYNSWTLTTFVNNVTDKRGVLGGGLDSLAGPTFFTHIQPRTIGVNIVFSY